MHLSTLNNKDPFKHEFQLAGGAKADYSSYY